MITHNEDFDLLVMLIVLVGLIYFLIEHDASFLAGIATSIFIVITVMCGADTDTPK